MATSTAVHPSVRAAFDTLIDYAGLFPPAQLEPPAAEREYLAARAGPQAWMLGRFIVPAAGLTRADLPSPVLSPSSLSRVWRRSSEVAGLRERGLNIEVLEIPLGTSRPESVKLLEEALSRCAAARYSGVCRSIRVRRRGTSRCRDDDARLARAGVGAKIRCGGLTASAFPSVEEVATFIAAAQAHGVPFKATAGLHHPVRHVDPNTGFTMHGFLNLLAAAALAPSLEPEALATIVAEEEPQRLSIRRRVVCVARSSHRRRGGCERTRRSGFVAYGSCSFAEPVDDLVALGMPAVAHRSQLGSVVTRVPPESDFPIQNLPFGVFAEGGMQRIGVAIGDEILNLHAVAEGGLFDDCCEPELLQAPVLNPLLAAGRIVWGALRERLTDLLRAGGDNRLRDAQRRSLLRETQRGARCAFRWRSATMSTFTRRSNTRRISDESFDPMLRRCYRTGDGCRSVITDARAPL